MKTKGLPHATEWLKKLDKQVRRVVEGDHGSLHSFPKRPLTEEEWERVRELIAKHELPCALGHAAYGFFLSVFGHGVIKGETPEFLVSIDDSQFPMPSARRGFAGQEETLKQLSPITHTKRNAELLDWYGFRPLDPAERYIY